MKEPENNVSKNWTLFTNHLPKNIRVAGKSPRCCVDRKEPLLIAKLIKSIVNGLVDNGLFRTRRIAGEVGLVDSAHYCFYLVNKLIERRISVLRIREVRKMVLRLKLPGNTLSNKSSYCLKSIPRYFKDMTKMGSKRLPTRKDFR